MYDIVIGAAASVMVVVQQLSRHGMTAYHSRSSVPADGESLFPSSQCTVRDARQGTKKNSLLGPPYLSIPPHRLGFSGCMTVRKMERRKDSASKGVTRLHEAKRKKKIPLYLFSVSVTAADDSSETSKPI